MPNGNKQPVFTFESVHAQDRQNPKFTLLSELIFGEFGGAALEELLSASSNATILACERHRKARGNKIAVLALGYFGENTYVRWIADRSARPTSHVAFFLDQLEQHAFPVDAPTSAVLTVRPGNLRPDEFLRRGYEENKTVPGYDVYQITKAAVLHGAV